MTDNLRCEIYHKNFKKWTISEWWILEYVISCKAVVAMFSRNIRHIKKYMEREDSTMIEGEEGQKEREQTVYNILKWK